MNSLNNSIISNFVIPNVPILENSSTSDIFPKKVKPFSYIEKKINKLVDSKKGMEIEPTELQEFIDHIIIQSSNHDNPDSILLLLAKAINELDINNPKCQKIILKNMIDYKFGKNHEVLEIIILKINNYNQKYSHLILNLMTDKIFMNIILEAKSYHIIQNLFDKDFITADIIIEAASNGICFDDFKNLLFNPEFFLGVDVKLALMSAVCTNDLSHQNTALENILEWLNDEYICNDFILQPKNINRIIDFMSKLNLNHSTNQTSIIKILNACNDFVSNPQFQFKIIQIISNIDNFTVDNIIMLLTVDFSKNSLGLKPFIEIFQKMSNLYNDQVISHFMLFLNKNYCGDDNNILQEIINILTLMSKNNASKALYRGIDKAIFNNVFGTNIDILNKILIELNEIVFPSILSIISNLNSIAVRPPKEKMKLYLLFYEKNPELKLKYNNFFMQLIYYSANSDDTELTDMAQTIYSDYLSTTEICPHLKDYANNELNNIPFIFYKEPNFILIVSKEYMDNTLNPSLNSNPSWDRIVFKQNGGIQDSPNLANVFELFPIWKNNYENQEKKFFGDKLATVCAIYIPESDPI